MYEVLTERILWWESGYFLTGVATGNLCLRMQWMMLTPACLGLLRFGIPETRQSVGTSLIRINRIQEP